MPQGIGLCPSPVSGRGVRALPYAGGEYVIVVARSPVAVKANVLNESNRTVGKKEAKLVHAVGCGVYSLCASACKQHGRRKTDNGARNRVGAKKLGRGRVDLWETKA